MAGMDTAPEVRNVTDTPGRSMTGSAERCVAACTLIFVALARERGAKCARHFARLSGREGHMHGWGA